MILDGGQHAYLRYNQLHTGLNKTDQMTLLSKNLPCWVNGLSGFHAMLLFAAAWHLHATG